MNTSLRYTHNERRVTIKLSRDLALSR